MSADTTTGRSPLVLLGIGLGVLALLAALWFLVISPLLAEDEVEPVPSQGAQQGTEAPADPAGEPTEVASEPEDIPVATYEIFLSRDPFQPVIDDTSGGGGGGTDGGGTDGGGTDGGGTDGGGTDGGGTDGGGTDGGGTDGGGNGGTDDPCQDESATNETVCDDIVVELVDVGEDGQGPFIVIELTPAGGSPTSYGPLRVGDRFGPQDQFGQGRFRVLDIFDGSGCARLSYVDDSFQICRGDRVLK